MTALVKGGDVDVVGGVFLYNATSLFIRVERIHQNKWNIHIMSLVEVLQNGVRIPNNVINSQHFTNSPIYIPLFSLILSLTYLNLTHAQVQKCHSVTNFNSRFGTNTAHRRSKTAIQLENSKFVEIIGCGTFR